MVGARYDVYDPDRDATEARAGRVFTRNRQLSTFNDMGLGAKLSYDVRKVPGRYDVKLNGTYEYTRYKFKDFTDVRTGSLHTYNASVIQVYLSATY